MPLRELLGMHRRGDRVRKLLRYAVAGAILECAGFLIYQILTHDAPWTSRPGHSAEQLIPRPDA